MTYLVAEAKTPSNFVSEKIPQAERDAFDFSRHRLYTPLGGARWPTDRWVVDKERRVALVGGGTNGNYAADEDIATTFWETLLVEGLSVGVIYKRAADLLEGKDPVTGRRHVIKNLSDTYLYLPAALYARKDEVIALLEEAYFVDAGGPQRPWIRGAKVDLTAARLDTEYGHSKHGV
ncbi:hypothetical protein LPB72_10475 [Hydrogenophaga crassostreae]|uniref:Uncharacterized protein n=1 Tax=Hydrogenophaga crassostreae TaxID=1763535 RepID=A0A167HTW4_9BURK|nr:hypothetical protein [Hydrogenophaga crassostreae]AOW13442.1 hypothetical protein LPB072_11855 [Hydrogenophaga crassostreae]OAD41733.1 hypothetical protein LPB72_10475 [Hydrogenophaga crassostreae]